MSLLNALASRQLLVVTGKGGVGKSVVSIVLARLLAASGRRVLLLEVDPRENLHELAGVSPSGGDVVRLGPGLRLQNLQPKQVIEQVVRDHLRVERLVRRVVASPVFTHFVDAAPGLKELAILGHAFRVLHGHAHGVSAETVVVDAPATGHGMSVLAAPDADRADAGQEQAPQPEPKRKVRGKPFTKGDPRANRLGRPKLGTTLAAKYRDALAEAESEARGANYTKLDAMIDILMAKALKGDLDAIKYLQERGFGKVPDRLELAAEIVDKDEQRYDYSRLTLDELDCLTVLTQKLAGEEPKELFDYVGTEKRYYHYVLAKEYIDTPALIEGPVKG